MAARSTKTFAKPVPKAVVKAASKPPATKLAVKTASAARSVALAADPLPPAARPSPVAAAVKTVATPLAKTAKAAGAKSVKPAREDKPKKQKLVRDSFTIPKPEYAVLEALKVRASKAGNAAKKSEVLRAGIKALAGMDDAAFAAAMGVVPALKTGRPSKA